MIKTSCISHAPGQSIVMVRQDYLNLCEGATIDVGSKPRKVDAACAAALMNLFEHWTNWKLATLQQSTRENDIAAAGGLERSQNEEMWIWQTTDDMHEALAGIWGKTKIEDARKWLVQEGYLQQRNNPKFKWDRTFQYFYDLHHVNSRLGSLDSKPAIPKITTEPTIKDKNPTPPALPATDEQLAIPTDEWECYNPQTINLEATATPADDIFPMDENGYWEKSLTHPGMLQERVYAGASLPPAPEPEPEPPTPFKTMQAAVIAAFGNKSYWWAGIRANLLLGTVKDKTGGWKQYQMTEQPATVAEVLGFAAWWKRTYPNATIPSSAEKLRDNFERFRGEASYDYFTGVAQSKVDAEVPFDAIMAVLISGNAVAPLPDAPAIDEPEEEAVAGVMPTPEEQAAYQKQAAELMAKIIAEKSIPPVEEPNYDD